MPVMGIVCAGQPYQVSFGSDPTTQGASSLATTWMAAGGPPRGWTAVAPGQTGTLSGTAPAASDAQALVVLLDVPDGAAQGTLAVSSAGQQVVSKPVTADSRWLFLVE